MRKGNSYSSSYRPQSQFSGAGRIEAARARAALVVAQEEERTKPEPTERSGYIKPAATNAELNEQFMSEEALALKRKTPMFNPIPL